MNKDYTCKKKFLLRRCAFIFPIVVILILISLVTPANPSAEQSSRNETTSSQNQTTTPSSTTSSNPSAGQSSSSETTSSSKNQKLTITIESVSPYEPRTGADVIARGSVSGPLGSISNTDIGINWGDDQATSPVYPKNDGSWTASHIYNSVGSYTISTTASTTDNVNIITSKPYDITVLKDNPGPRTPEDNSIPSPTKTIQQIIPKIIPPKLDYLINSDIPQLPLVPIIMLGIAIVIIAITVKSRRRRRHKLQLSSPGIIEIRTEGGLE